MGTDGAIAEPNNLRFLTPKISVRTPNEDSNRIFEQRTGLYSPLDSFEVDLELSGSARVESLASRVDLRNFTLRRLK